MQFIKTLGDDMAVLSFLWVDVEIIHDVQSGGRARLSVWRRPAPPHRLWLSESTSALFLYRIEGRKMYVHALLERLRV